MCWEVVSCCHNLYFCYYIFITSHFTLIILTPAAAEVGDLIASTGLLELGKSAED